jgi:hypothetical protein
MTRRRKPRASDYPRRRMQRFQDSMNQYEAAS